MRKLIGMTEYVLEQVKNATTQTEKYAIIEWQNKCDAFDKTNAYANFLKQPLKLGMFVHTDEEGNVLESYYYDRFESGHLMDNEEMILVEQYQQAKERVIFEGFELNDKNETGYGVINNELVGIWIRNDGNNKTIEDLIKFNLTLTENKIFNQIK